MPNNFCEISTGDLSYVITDKSTVEILQNFVAFSEYMNFNILNYNIIGTYLLNANTLVKKNLQTVVSRCMTIVHIISDPFEKERTEMKTK